MTQDISPREFLNAFFDDEEIVHFFLFDEREYVSLKKNERRKILKSFKVKDIETELPELLNYNRQGLGVYFRTNLGGINDESIQRINMQFFEIDKIPKEEQWRLIERLPLRPSIIVETKKSYHCYYLVRNADIAVFRRIQKKLQQFMDSDPSRISLSQANRFPFSLHVKQREPYQTTLKEFNRNLVYTQEQIESMLPDLRDPMSHQPRTKTKSTSEIARQIPDHSHSKFLKLLLSRVDVTSVRQHKATCHCVFANRHKNGDQKASAVFFTDTLSYYCLGCGASFGIYELCTKMGWKDIIEQLNLEGYGFLLQQSKESLVPVDEFIEPSVDTDTASRFNRLVGNVKSVLSRRGITLSSNHSAALNSMSRVLAYPWTSSDKIAVIPARPGSGKSTIVEEFLKEQLLSPGFGAIVVKERREDLISLQESLGEKAYALYGFTPADCLKGIKTYSLKTCKACTENCRVKTNYQKQFWHPILLITHERLFRLLDGERDVRSLNSWYDEHGQAHQRSILLIDEKPRVSVIHAFERSDLDELHLLLSEDTLPRHLGSSASQLIGYLQKINSVMLPSGEPFTFPAIDAGYLMPPNLKRFLSAHFDDDKAEIINRVENIIAEGGVVSSEFKQPSKTKILTRHSLDLTPLKEIRTIIFDGTAQLDTDYRRSDFAILDIKLNDPYPNLTFHNCKRISASRNQIHQRKQVFADETIAADIVDLAVKDTLVLVYKFRENSIREKLEERGLDGKTVYIEHLGNVKGKNSYGNLSRMVIYGNDHKGDAYYFAKHLAITGKQSIEKVSAVNFAGYRKIRNFAVQDIAENDILVELIQNVQRLSIRKNNLNRTDVFLFLANPVLLTKLRLYFVGCSIETWLPARMTEAYLTETNAKILELGLAIQKHLRNPGDTVHKKQLMEAADYSHHETFRRALDHDSIRQLLSREKIMVKHHFLVKTA